MWEARRIEDITEQKLINEFGSEGKAKFAIYVATREKLVDSVLEEIKAIEPFLTDHGPKHVSKVLDNAERLLGDEINNIPSQDLYSLILSILFHDVGNIYKRKKHQKNVSNVLKIIWPKRSDFRNEYRIITQAVMAHCGLALDGSKDTLQDVNETVSLLQQPVGLRKIAAIVRLADELEEGPHRTSPFQLERDYYPKDNLIYHQYSSLTDILIDRNDGRIALTYDLDIDCEETPNCFPVDKKDHLTELLTLIYDRIVKLDEERQYTKYYCSYLDPFKKTTVAFNFVINGDDSSLGIEIITLNDKVIPGNSSKIISDLGSEYNIDNIVEKVRLKIEL